MKPGHQQRELRSVEATSNGGEMRSVSNEHEITQWLAAYQKGGPGAFEKLSPLVTTNSTGRRCEPLVVNGLAAKALKGKRHFKDETF